MRVRVWCFPLAENQFRNAIVANYYQNTPTSVPGKKLHFFQFELDHAQTRVLMDMFTPSPPPNNVWMPPVATPADEHVREYRHLYGHQSMKRRSNQKRLQSHMQTW